MSYSSFPWKSNSGDRKFTSDDLTKFLEGRQSDGVASGLIVKPYNSMTVMLTDGFASIQGKQFLSETDSAGIPTTIDCGTASGSHSKYVSISLRKTISLRTIVPVLKDGTAAATPLAPAVERTADIYELRLADILIPKGATEITADMIHITVAESECGISINQPQSVDTESFAAEMDAWLELYKSAKQTEFNTWFNALQDVLNENTAANLYSAISAKKDIVICSSDNQPAYSEGQIVGILEE